MDNDEGRRPSLTDADVEKIKGAIHQTFAGEFIRWCETIGYDVSSQESRSAIRDDHRFIRLFRKGAVWVIGAALVAIAGAAAAGWVGP